MKRLLTSFGAFLFSVAALATSSVSFIQQSSRLALAQVGVELPVGAVYVSVSATNPGTSLGYGTWTAFGGGRTLVGLDAGQSEFDTAEETGGAKTVAAAGSNSEPAFVGVALGTHSHGPGTIATSAHSGAAVADHAAHTHGFTPAGTNSAPTFTGSALGAHAHELPFQKVAGGTSVLRMLAASIFGTGTSRAAESQSAAPTANTTSAAVALSQAVSAGTPAGTVSAPTFTGSGGTTGNPGATLTHSVTQPGAHALSGSSEAVSAGALLGTVSAPNFTGTPTSVLQPYVTVYFFKRVS